MRLTDFALLALICLVWGLNLAITRWVVADVPPFFYAFVRFALLALVLAPWLRPVPRQLGLVATAGLCVGGLNFMFLFLALKYGTTSEVAIVSQLGLPVTTILSILFLGERVRWRRGLGMALAFAGVMAIAYDPTGLSLSIGAVLGAAAVLAGSAGSILMKRMEPVGLMTLQAWVAMVSWPLLLPLTLFTETGQVDAALNAGWPFAAATVFSVFCVSIFGHGLFYRILQTYEVTLVSPLTLMTPLWAVFFGVTLLGEVLTPKLVIGGLLALTGVFMIAVRPNVSLHQAVALWRRWFA